VVLDEGVRRLLHRLKYHGWHRLAAVMAPALQPLLADVGPGPLVPVPADPRRTRRRGFDQAVELALALAGHSGRVVERGRLWRVRQVGSQTRLGAAERRANLAGVFAARSRPGPVVLVDDVFTTGATLVSAATACLDAGATRVAALTFARAEPPLLAASRRFSFTFAREA
jgi:ComF family protein